MVFFTRQLYDGVQDCSGWTRKAENEWRRRARLYQAYLDLVAPMFPKAVVGLAENSLHDAVVESLAQNTGTLSLIMDAGGTAGPFSGRRVQLTFGGMKRPVSTRRLVGQWWFYEELHFSSRARFSLHVLFDTSELQIEADEVSIRRLGF